MQMTDYRTNRRSSAPKKLMNYWAWVSSLYFQLSSGRYSFPYISDLLFKRFFAGRLPVSNLTLCQTRNQPENEGRKENLRRYLLDGTVTGLKDYMTTILQD